MPMKAAIPFNKRSSNTSETPWTSAKEEKIVRLGSITPTDPLVTATTGRRRAGTRKATIQSPANLKGEHNLGNNILKASNKSSAT